MVTVKYATAEKQVKLTKQRRGAISRFDWRTGGVLTVPETDVSD